MRKLTPVFLLIGLLIAILLITMACSVDYSKTQMFMKETAAIKAIQMIHQTEAQYQLQYGRYAVSLAELGPPASGAAGPASAGLIGNDLAQGARQGYKFTLTGNPGGYVIHAVPKVYGSSGSRTFYSDQTLVIRENYGPEPATVNSKELR